LIGDFEGLEQTGGTLVGGFVALAAVESTDVGCYLCMHGGPGEVAMEPVDGIGDAKMPGDDGIMAVTHQR
jgi:hypothetical protein